MMAAQLKIKKHKEQSQQMRNPKAEFKARVVSEKDPGKCQQTDNLSQETWIEYYRVEQGSI